MRELLALSGSQPTRLTFSPHALATRGGLMGRSHDGWGIAFCEGHDVALFSEPRPAADSAAADQATGVAVHSDGTSVVWVASVPLTDDPWQPLACGDWVAIRDGRILTGDSTTCTPIATAGAGDAV